LLSHLAKKSTQKASTSIVFRAGKCDKKNDHTNVKSETMQNHFKPIMCRIQFTMLIGAICWLLAPASRAALNGPYNATNGIDGYTLHLWHFDEVNVTNPPPGAPTNALAYAYAYDAITNNPQTSPLYFSYIPGQVGVSGWPGYPPSNFAIQGQPGYSYPGVANYGYCVETTNFSCLLAPFYAPNPTTVNAVNFLAGTNLSDVINTNTGAFTFEALVCPIVNPLTAGRNMEIISGDSGFAFRAWQFRINASGQLEANIGINNAGTTVHDVFMTLPSTGPDAVVAGQWYHVAVTYTGDTPTNGDTAKQLKLYWTYMDPTRTNADVLLATNLTYGFTNIAVPLLAIGGSGRGSPIQNVANSEGFVGLIDEARISSYCRKSTEMAFNTNLFVASPVVNISSDQTNQLVGYGHTYAITPTESGTVPITNQWFQNGIALPGQTNLALIITNVTFAANGNYQLFATNSAGSASSVVCPMTVGAAFNGAFNSGVDANGNGLYLTAPGSADLHYQLVQSADPNNPGPNAIIWGGTPNGGAPSTAVSCWIGPRNGNGAPNGTYAYQTEFQIDNGDIASSVLSGKMLAGGTSANVVQAFLNGVETDITLAPNSVSTLAPFVITNGLQAGSNTLVFTLNDGSGNFPGLFQVQLASIGNALPPGLPTFNSQPPASQTVPYGGTAFLPVVALGRPPLSYQWLSNGVPISPTAIPSAINQYCTFAATNVNPAQIVGGNFTASYQVVVSNDSGSVTSSVANVTIQIPLLSVTSAGVPIWNPTSNETNVVVTFSDLLVDPVTAATAGNYSLDNGAIVSSAALVAPNEVVLTTSTLNPVTAYRLTVQNVKDIFNDTMSPSPTSIAVGIYPAATALWVKASTGVTTDANGVNQWNDLSGNGNNLLNSSGPPYEPQLATNVITGQPVIRFAATNETFLATASSTTSLAITNDMAVFAVVNFATLAGGTNGMIVSKTGNNNVAAPYDYYANSSAVQFFRGNGATSQTVSSSKLPSIGFSHVLDVVMQGTSVSHRLDGATNGSGALSTVITDGGSPLYVGTRYDQVNRLSGDLAELIVIGSAPSAYDVSSIENYLAAEYDLPTGPNSYPVITQQPVASTNISQGTTLKVAAAASGTPAVAYQWYDINNIPIAGQTNATLVVNDVQTSDSYYLQATNIYGSVNSSIVAVGVIAGLNVSLGPPSVTVYAGQTYTYSAVALGTVPFYYQWYQGASPIPNATNASYSAVALLGSATYSCTVTNAYNGYSSTNAGPVSLIGVAAPTNLYATTVLGNHPVAYWRLTEVPDNGLGNGGVVANDFVGGHNALYTNMVLGLPGFSSLSSTDTAAEFGVFSNIYVTTGITGTTNGGVTNNIVNSYAGEIDQSGSGLSKIDFATPAGGNAEFSVEAWVTVFENVKTNLAQVGGAGIVTKGYGNGGEQFDLDLNGGFRFFVRDASGSVHSSVSGSTPVTNGWYHLVGVWDGASGTAHLYTNGVDVGPSPAAPGVGLLAATTTNTLLPQAALVSIGARASSQATNNFDLQFKGRICDVAVYNYAFSHANVQADYVAGLKNAVFSSNPTNIVPSVTGANLTLFWPVDHFGWQLQAQTNSLSAGLGTNWVNVGGSTFTNQVVVPMVRTNVSVFYRLTYVP
jgi:hypothetical protein